MQNVYSIEYLLDALVIERSSSFSREGLGFVLAPIKTLLLENNKRWRVRKETASEQAFARKRKDSHKNKNTIETIAIYIYICNNIRSR